MTTTTAKTTKAGTWQVTLRFISKEEAEDFLEDVSISKKKVILQRLKRAEEESKTGKARLIGELYKKYGV